MSRVAIVTGGTRGIGRAICEALHARGYKVAGNYAGNDEAAAKFTAETGIAAYKWDVADYDACQAGVDKVVADLGPVDIIVNNAGITRDGTLYAYVEGELAEGDRYQSRLLFQHGPCGIPIDARAGVWAHRQYRVD